MTYNCNYLILKSLTRIAQIVRNDKTQGSRLKLMDLRFSVQVSGVPPESELKFNSGSDVQTSITKSMSCPDKEY